MRKTLHQRNHVTKELLSLLLIIIFILSVTACGKEPGTPDTTTGKLPEAAVTSAGETTAAETELNAMNTLGARDFGNDTITFYSRVYSGDWTSDLLSEEISGELVKSAIASRNMKLMNQYNVKFAEEKSGAQSFFKNAENQITAGAYDFDVLYTSMRDGAQLTVDGFLLEIGSVPNIKTDKSWWSPFLTEQLSIAGKNYYITGELTTVDDISIRAIFFNKTMLQDLDKSINLYDLVEGDKWDLDTMFRLIDAALIDAENDGKFELGKDVIGLLAEGTIGYQLLMGTGEKIVAKDSEDIPYVAITEGRPIEVVDYLTSHISGNMSVQTNTKVTDYFAEGGILFAPVTIARLNNLKAYDIDFGVVPYPKFNADQELYHCYSDSYCPNAISFPFNISESRLEAASFIVEAMSVESVGTLTPQFYEVCMKMKNARDERTGPMLDIIRNDYMIDLADVYLNTWGIRTPVTNAISSGTSLKTAIGSLEKKTNKLIEQTASKIAGLDH